MGTARTIQQDIRERLETLAEEDYRAFHQNLCPGTQNILGVRVGHLRALAKEIAKGDWRAYLKNANYDYYEEISVAGLTIGYAKTNIEEKLGYVAGFVPRIDNWAVCDTFCSNLKDFKKHRERVLGFLQPYLASDKEFELRFGVVTLMDYFIDADYLQRLFGIFDGIDHEGYYVKMAVAWAVSVCFAKFPVETMRYLRACKLDTDTKRKALQKILESYRVSGADKEKIRAMRGGLK